MKYFICGFTGSGKTFMLRSLENSFELSHLSFIDLDQLIDQEHAENYHSLAHLIDDIGFEAFREIEFNKIAELSVRENIIVSLGGGALNQKTLDIFEKQGWRGFWLNTEFEKCFERISGDANRPLSRLSERELRQIYHDRLPYYRQFQEVSTLSDILKHIKE